MSEMSAREVLQTMSEICKWYYAGTKNCAECPFNAVQADGSDLCDNSSFGKCSDRIIEICEQWKADHEKKEIEVEWITVVRIMDVAEDKCVFAEEINLGATRETIECIFKKYCKEHDGEYIAKIETDCRVKG